MPPSPAPWPGLERGIVLPAEFIPVAEETALILPLGDAILEQACEQLAAWSARPETAHLCLAVNVSARQFHHPGFVARVRDVIAHTGAPPRNLWLELTESLLVADVEDTISKMDALGSSGIRFALDDFGTRYSSLSYLKRLPLDQVKIDYVFVQQALANRKDRAIVRTIIVLAQTMELDVIAEGVETAEQRDFLAGYGCMAYQGYLFSPALPVEEFETFIRRAYDESTGGREDI